MATLVYGAGNAGAIVARMASSDGLPGIQIVGFLDDDRRKHGSRLLGHRVYGGLDDLTQSAEREPGRPPAPHRHAVGVVQAGPGARSTRHSRPDSR